MPQSPSPASISVPRPMSPEDAAALLSAHTRQEIERWAQRYPPGQRRSAVLAALRETQHQNRGYLTRKLLDAIAVYLELPPIFVYEAASFYSMIETREVGRHCVAVCTNISCMLRGGEEMLTYIEDKLGIEVGESTADGRVYLKREEECLAACCGAPMMQVDHVYHEQLTHEKIDHILDGLE